MKIYAGRYSWDGKKHTHEEPIAWFPGTYNLNIFDVSKAHAGATPLKPVLCVYSKTGQGMSISASPEKFAKHICSDFSLEIDKVLWAEELAERSGSYEVIVFTRSGKLGNNYFYRTSKRPPLEGERRIIEKEMAELRNIK